MANLQITFIFGLLFQNISSTPICPDGLKWLLDKKGLGECFPCHRCPDGTPAVVNCTNEHDTICENCTNSQYYSTWDLRCKACTFCEAGSYITKNCSEFKDTECDFCPDGHYSLVQNSRYCLECTNCTRTVIHNCSRTTDTVCEQIEEQHDIPDKETLFESGFGFLIAGISISVFLLMFCFTHAYMAYRRNKPHGATIETAPLAALKAAEETLQDSAAHEDTLQEFKKNLRNKLMSMISDSPDGTYAGDDELYAKFNMISKTPDCQIPSEVKNIRDIFFERETAFKRICVIGDASIGKTALCRCLIHAFCSNNCSHQHEVIPSHGKDRQYVEAMSMFEFLFYIPLRNFCSYSNVIDIIKEHYFLNRDDLYQQIFDGEKRVLVVLDGLGQWIMQGASKLRKIYFYDNCTILITTRPCALKQYQPSEISKFDREIMMKNITKQEAHTLKDALVKKWRKEKNGKEDGPNARIMALPFLLKQIVRLEIALPSDEQLYKIIEKVLLHLLKSTEFDETLNNEIDFPECLHPDLKRHKLLLSLLGKVSYENLPVHDSHSIVFRYKKLCDDYDLTKEMITVCLKDGILTQEMDNSNSKEDVTISFPHRIYQEFFASIFLVFNPNLVQEFCGKLKTLDDILSVQFVVIFLCGMVPTVAKDVCKRLNQISISEDSVNYDEESLKEFQFMLLDSAIEQQSPLIDCKLCSIFICLKTLDEERKNLLGHFIDSTITSSMHFIQGKRSKYAATTNVLLNSLKACQLKCITIRLGGNLAKSTKDILLKIINNSNTILTKLELRGSESKPFLSYLNDNKITTLLKLGISHVEVDHAQKQALMTHVAKAVNLQELVLIDIKCQNHDRDPEHCPCILDLQECSQLKRLLLKQIQVEWVRVSTSNLKESNIDTDITVFYCPEDEKFRSSQELKLWGLRYRGSQCNIDTIADLLPNLTQLSVLELGCFNFGNIDICLPARAMGLRRVELHNVSMATDKLVNFINSIPTTEHEIFCVFKNFADSENRNFDLTHFVSKINGNRFEVTKYEKCVPTGVTIEMKTRNS